MTANQPFAIPAVAMAVFSIPLILRWVPRNRFYGFRTPKTLADDASWKRVNTFGGWALMVASLVYLAVAYFVPMAGLHDSRFERWTVHLLAFAVPVAAALILTLSRIKRR